MRKNPIDAGIASGLERYRSGALTLAYRPVGLRPRAAALPPAKSPVVFIHGLSYFSYDWVRFGERLCVDRPGCAMDMRGFGDSDFSPDGDYSVSSMAQDIGKLLDHLGWQQAVLVAHSMGGRSATCFAARHPGRVKGLVLVDWSPENAPAGSRRVAQTVANAPEVFATVDDMMRYFGTDSDSPDSADRRARFQAYSRAVPGGFALKRDSYFRKQFQRQLETGQAPKRDVDIWQLLGEVAAPTLVLRASRSDLFAPETLPKVVACNPRIHAQEIAAGHHIVGDNPDAALAAIRPFINALEAP
jgi:esterase